MYPRFKWKQEVPTAMYMCFPMRQAGQGLKTTAHPIIIIEPISRSNFSSGVMKCPFKEKLVWIDIENPRKIHSVDVTVEVVAIVKRSQEL